MATIQQIKKRNGNIVDFDESKIATVIRKAFIAVRGSVEDDRVAEITRSVVSDLGKIFADRVPSVESVQDLVERAIMLEGFFDVAKAYIIYRYEHTKEREEKKQEVIKKIEEHELTVVKRSGAREVFLLEKVRHSVERAAHGLEKDIDIEAIILQCQTEVYDNINTSEIARALMMTARAFIERDPAYSKLAARLLISQLAKEVIGPEEIDYAHFDEQYRRAFVRNLKKAVESGRLDQRMLSFGLEELARRVDPSRDDLLVYLGAQMLYDRYFLRDGEGKRVLETPQAFWMRVAMGLAINEDKKTEWAMKFYEALSTLRYIPSTPTLFHAGMPKAQLASCFLNTVGDDLRDIFKSYSDNAQLLKWSGGMGTDWTSVRATGSLIKSTAVESQGVIPFLKIANDVTISINRSGRRRGAACVYLETWHYDIEDFLELRKNTGDERRRTHDLNTANWIPDLFMKRVREDGQWTLFSPEEVPDLHETYGRAFEERYTAYERMADEGHIKLWKRMPARDLWKKMLGMLFETGHPWVTFKDPCNVRSPQDHAGVVHNSNLCTEITLNNSAEETAVCNLGSFNYIPHIRNGAFDAELARDTVSLGMRMLDNVIDANFYPTPETKTSNTRHRPVGLGVMGFHDALYMLGMNFDSEAVVEFADNTMEVIAFDAYLASTELARERGAYESFKGSKWDRGIMPFDTIEILERERGEKIPISRRSLLDWNVVRESIRQYGMRNSNCLAIAPTATISNIAGSIPSIEPIYKNIYVKANISGDFTIVNEYLVEDLKAVGLWSSAMLMNLKYNDGNVQEMPEIPQWIKEKYKDTFQIDPRWVVRVAAHRGKWIDQSQSLNIFFGGSSGKQLSEIYQYAWEMGLKTTYYLRTLAASQVEKSTINAAEFGSTHTRKQSESLTEAVLSVAAEVVAVEIPQPHGSSVVAEAVAVVASDMLRGEIHEPISVAMPIGSKPIPLCKIDDPICESCQ